jgi:hypothetical protein
MKYLYVTTFNKDLYQKSGKDLITSFHLHITNGDLLVCYEDFNFSDDSFRVIPYNLEKDPYMNKWLQENKEIIPKKYGGTAGDDSDYFKDNTPDYWGGSKGQYWANYRASRYFRKIVSLNYALSNFSEKYDYIFVVDCDCIFKKNINKELISTLFENETSMIYFWSRFRKKINRGPETGFTGYCKRNKGFEFAKIICNCFSSGEFIKYKYWDDGYVIGQIINEYKSNKKFKLKDLVGHLNSKTTRVMDIKDQSLFEYIKHFKNKHKESVF